MPLPKYAALRDANEKEIIAALEWAGCTIERISKKGVPDLLVGCAPIYRPAVIPPMNFLLEVKTETGTMTPDETEFHGRWAGQIAVVRTIEDALRAVGRAP